MESPKEVRKRVQMRPVPGRDTPQQLEANARRRERYAHEWERVQDLRRKSSKKCRAMVSEIKNEDVRPEHFLRTSYAGLLNAKQRPEYLLLRQRFRAIFLWPEILAACAPPVVRLQLPQPIPPRPDAQENGNVVSVNDVSALKDAVMSQMTQRGKRRRGRPRLRVTLASEKRKYMNSWMREQKRVAKLAERIEETEEQPDVVELPYAISSLHEEVVESVEDDDDVQVIE